MPLKPEPLGTIKTFKWDFNLKGYIVNDFFIWFTCHGRYRRDFQERGSVPLTGVSLYRHVLNAYMMIVALKTSSQDFNNSQYFNEANNGFRIN